MRTLSAAAVALSLSACGGMPLGNSAAETSKTETMRSADGTEAKTKASARAGSRDCDVVKPSDETRNILGLAVGMTPAQIEGILICRGFVSTFPQDEAQARAIAQEREQGLFRSDYGLIGKGDFVRVFFDGPTGMQKAFFIGRTKVFQESPPTMDAIARQFHETFKLAPSTRRTHLGNLEAGAIDPRHTVPEDTQRVTKRCAELALLHDPDDRFSIVMNVPPYGDANCGPSITMEIIQNGTNPNLAYLARYRLANPQLGKQWRDARITGEQNAESMRLDRQTKEAIATGTLPDM